MAVDFSESTLPTMCCPANHQGQALFWVLLFFEVPFLLNFLVFDRKRWSA